MNFDEIRPELDKWFTEARNRPKYIGPGKMNDRVHLHDSGFINNAIFNCNSGHIHLWQGVCIGHDVLFLTCTHNVDATGWGRRDYPSQGRDIDIGREVFIGSRALILGPCRIGDYSAVGAGSVVLEGKYPSGVLIAGNPARVVRPLRLGEVKETAAAEKPLGAARPLLITIERGAQRRVDSIKNLRHEGIDFEIVDGIDGKTSLPLPRTGAREMKNTELACYHSHIRALRRVVDYGWPHALILEDDFHLRESGKLATVLDDLPEGCDYLALHRIFKVEDSQVISRGEKFNRLRPIGVTTISYVVSQRLAQLVLEKYPSPDRPIDFLYCDISRDVRLDYKFYELASPIVQSRGGPSIIHE